MAKEPIVELNKYYIDTDGTVIKLIGIMHMHDKFLATLYEMVIIKEGKYPSLNQNSYVSYTQSAMLKCKRISDKKALAIELAVKL